MRVECGELSCQYLLDGRCRAPVLRLGKKQGSEVCCFTYYPQGTEPEVRLCPACGGILSRPREHDGILLRHCYSCHFEFKEETK